MAFETVYLGSGGIVDDLRKENSYLRTQLTELRRKYDFLRAQDRIHRVQLVQFTVTDEADRAAIIRDIRLEETHID